MDQPDVCSILIHEYHLISSLETSKLENGFVTLEMNRFEDHFRPDKFMVDILVCQAGLVWVNIVSGSNCGTGLPVLLIPEAPLKDAFDARVTKIAKKITLESFFFNQIQAYLKVAFFILTH